MRLLPVGICLAALTVSIVAQTPQAAVQPASPAFEVAAIRPNKSGEQRGRADIQPSGRVTFTNMSLYELVRGAYGAERQEIERHLIVPGKAYPSWIESDRWDIVANAPAGTDRDQLRTMLRNLLTDRFKLVARRDTRQVPAYSLVVARADRRLGPQMRPSSADCDALAAAFRASGAPPSPNAPVCGRRSGEGRIWGTGILVPELIGTLIPSAGRPIVDATGLTGRFDLDMKWTPDPVSADGISLFTAIQDQLGLRLEPGSAPLEVLVIESAERPTQE